MGAEISQVVKESQNLKTSKEILYKMITDEKKQQPRDPKIDDMYAKLGRDIPDMKFKESEIVMSIPHPESMQSIDDFPTPTQEFMQKLEEEYGFLIADRVKYDSYTDPFDKIWMIVQYTKGQDFPKMINETMGLLFDVFTSNLKEEDKALLPITKEKLTDVATSFANELKDNGAFQPIDAGENKLGIDVEKSLPEQLLSEGVKDTMKGFLGEAKVMTELGIDKNEIVDMASGIVSGLVSDEGIESEKFMNVLDKVSVEIVKKSKEFKEEVSTEITKEEKEVSTEIKE